MAEEYWLQEAKQLPEGKKNRVKCCKQDNSMLVSNTHKGYSAYCFRCGFSKFQPHGARTIKQILCAKFETEFVHTKCIQLPSDYVSITDAPDHAKHWILEHGISLDLANEYRIGYSDKMDRVILPVFSRDTKVLLHCQARALDGRKPKYLNQESPTSHVVFFSHTSLCREPYYDYIVITEDILSTIKVGECSAAVCIMGTNMTPEKARQIAQDYDNAILWADSDEAGERCRTQAKKQLQLQGMVTVKTIVTPDDPKKHSYNAIEYALDQVQWLDD